MDNRTLREIYDYDMIPDEGMNFGSDEWFNVLMDKTEAQLTVSDICRMLRQKIFSVIAIGRAIELLEKDPFIGDMYEGQLLVNLCAAKEKYLKAHYGKLEEMLPKFIQLAISHSWNTAEEREDYISAADNFLKKLKEEKLS